MTLRFFYTLFLGLLVVAFVGFGIAAFYSAPKYPQYPATLAVRSLDSSTQSAQLVKEQEEYDKKLNAFSEENKVYNRNVSIISIISAILILFISIVFARFIFLLSDGLLLGGVFTLIYGIIRGFESGDDKFRFIVVSVGLLIALILGFIKFISPSQIRKK